MKRFANHLLAAWIAIVSATVATAGPFAGAGGTAGSGSGSVTSVNCTPSQGVTCSVTSPTTAPNVAVGLSDITPTTVTTGTVTVTTINGTPTINSPTLVTPALGTPASGVATNLTGTAPGLTAGHVTTNANLTGPITSTGNATTVGAQTGTGSTFVMQASPALTTPNIGTPSAGVLTNATGLPLTTGVTGILPAANGGAGTINGVLKANGAGVVSAAAAGTDYAAANASTTVNGASCALASTCAPYGGVATYTANHTVGASDIGKLVVMNCSSACTLTFKAAPASTDWWGVLSIGSTTATVSLNALNYNGAATVPALNRYRVMAVSSDGSNYFGEAPIVAGSNITLTPASNGFTVAAAGGGGSPGGSTLQLQYNNAGAFGGMSGTSWDNSGLLLTMTGRIQTAGGASNTPAYGFSTDNTTGIFSLGASDIRFSTGSNTMMALNGSTIQLPSTTSMYWNSDVGFARNAAGVVEVNSSSAGTFRDIKARNVIATGALRRAVFTVSTLPAGVQGDMAAVTDAVTCTFLAALTGGGSAFCPVIYNGTAWVAD